MSSDAARLTIRLLGPLEVLVAGRPIAVDTRKALAIVALVATERRPFARDELAAMFWPEAADEAARGALRRTLSALRTAVGETGLVIGRSQVALDPTAAGIDLDDLERLAASDEPADLEAAALLARGPFLAGFALRDSPAFDDWQAARADAVERTIGALFERLAAVRFAGGDPDGAVEAARRRVGLDPLDELGQRRLIELLAVSGDRSGAVRQYRELVALFDRELGVAPLRETTELYDAIREGRHDLAPGAERPPAGRIPVSGAVRVDDVPLAGREGELEAIAMARRASTRDGRVILIEGEAGIGKTRLGEAIATSVRAAGGVVLAARGYPGEGAIAYGPVAELLRGGAATRDGAHRLGSLDETSRLEIGRLIDLPATLRVEGVAGTPVPDPASARVRLLEAITEALSTLVAGTTPGLVWVDDLHHADDPTREALAYLARRLDRRSLLLCLAWRREDLPSGAIRTLDGLKRLEAATSLTLGRLDRDAVAGIVGAMRPAEARNAALIDALVTDSEGLPLHVVAALASDDWPGTGLPRGVQALIEERIASVGETAAQVLSAASVIGRSFDLGIVRQASGRSEEETVDAIEELSRRGVVREVPESGGRSVRYDFVHRGLRDAAYERTSLARRRLLHRRVADAIRLDETAGGRDDLSRFALIAGHEREAGRPAEAAAAYVEAADRAEAVFANREAIDHLESAIGLGYPDGAAAQTRIGELRSRLGEYPAAIAALETAAALAEPAELAGIEILLGRVHRRRGDLVAAASHLESALASFDLGDTARGRALVERSVVALGTGELDLAGAAATEVRSVAARVGDAHLAGVAERLVGLVAQERGDLAGALDALRRSVALAADDPDPTASIAALTGLALALAAGGAVDQAIATAGRAAEACRRIGDRHLEAAVENHLADMLHAAGREEDAMAHLKLAAARFADIDEDAREREPGIWALAAW